MSYTPFHELPADEQALEQSKMRDAFARFSESVARLCEAKIAFYDLHPDLLGSATLDRSAVSYHIGCLEEQAKEMQATTQRWTAPNAI